nr:E2/UBC family protein [Ferrimicrobium acidiphilum]
MRKEFALPPEDMEWLESCGANFELVRAGSVLRVVLYDVPIPPGYQVDRVTANVRIEAGYPDTQIDMVYFSPGLIRTNGRPIRATSPDQFDGKSWQRWSRHRTPANPWRPGIDNLATHFALVHDWLERETRKA